MATQMVATETKGFLNMNGKKTNPKATLLVCNMM